MQRNLNKLIPFILKIVFSFDYAILLGHLQIAARAQQVESNTGEMNSGALLCCIFMQRNLYEGFDRHQGTFHVPDLDSKLQIH